MPWLNCVKTTKTNLASKLGGLNDQVTELGKLVSTFQILNELWNRKARRGKARRSEPKLQKFDAVEIMDSRGVKMYENDAKLKNDQKVKLDWSK